MLHFSFQELDSFNGSDRIAIMKEYKTILWKVEEGIGHLVLNQPPSNHMTKAFFDELRHLTQKVILKSNAKAILVYGSGRHFSSGVELQDLFKAIDVEIEKHGSQDMPSFLIENNLSLYFLDQLKIPVIAVIQGVCLGSALELVMFCHIRICADNSLFALPESTFNLMPGCGGTQKLPQLAGIAKSMELILNGENFSARQACEWGIADVVLPRKKMMVQAVAFAKFVAKDYKRIFKKKYIKDFFVNG
ncbi:MAG: enoyl-CoA hydratase/isomerase family protein [Bacteroidota bacterium]